MALNKHCMESLVSSSACSLTARIRFDNGEPSRAPSAGFGKLVATVDGLGCEALWGLRLPAASLLRLPSLRWSCTGLTN